MFDCNKPVRCRDGRSVRIGNRKFGLLAGTFRSDEGYLIACCWDERSGLRVDTLGTSPTDLVNTEPTWSDEYIEHWGRVFESHRLFEMGIRFDTFLDAPREILEAIERQYTADRLAAGEYDDLLPEQHVASMLPDDARMRDGRFIQPLKHHSYAYSSHQRRAPV